MRISERDALLERLDERSLSVLRELESQNKHLENINGSLKRHEIEITEVRVTVYGEESDSGLVGSVKRIASRQVKLIIAVAVVSAGVGGSAAELIKLFT